MSAAGRGRPSVYTPEIAEEICRRIASGESLRRICRDEGMPEPSTVIGWVYDDREGFSEHYAQARRIQAELLGDEMFEIADDSSNDWMERQLKDGSVDRVVDTETINRSRLRVDTRKWYLSKVLPKVYGDRQSVEHTGKDGGPIETKDVSDIEAARRVAFLLTKGARSVDGV